MLSRVGLVLVLWLSLVGVAQAQEVIDVTRTDDRVGGTCVIGDCTLREAIAKAVPGDTVQLGGTPSAAQVYSLTQGTHLLVDKAITIAGGGQAATRIDGRGNTDTFSRVNRIMRSSATVTIRDLSFTGGRDGNDENFVSCSPCTTLTANGGGAIFNTAQLTLTRVSFESNQSSPTGGAVANNGTLALTDVEFHGNSASYGGALFSRSGTVTANGVAVHDNSSSARGTVFLFGGTMQLTNVTVTGNGQSNTLGGGVVNRGGALTLTNVTLADNTRGALMREAGSAVTTVRNSILGAGCVPAGLQTSEFRTVAAVSTDAGHNLDEDDTCGLTAATKIVGQSARLAPVNANGGATPTMAELSGSPAIDKVPVDDCAGTDQRGTLRQGGLCDIGAFEAVQLGQPSATTENADNVGVYEARLVATVGLAGEAGKLSFEWGLQPDAIDFRTPGIGIGPAAAGMRNEQVYGLPAATQIFYRAVAENASGVARGAVKSFTTRYEPPTISDLRVIDVGDESATLRFTVDPGASSGAYRIRINGDDPPLAPLPGTGPREITRTLTGLTPDADHQLQIVVTGPGGDTAQDDGLVSVHTLKRFTGTAGTALTVSHSGIPDVGCPSGALIAWGDGQTSTVPAAGIACVPSQSYTLTAAHTYATGGRYRARTTYDGGDRHALVAVVAPTTGRRVLSVNVTGRGRVTGSGIDCPGVCSVELPPNVAPALTATPAAGEQFHGWADACNGTGACELEMTESRNVAANFSGVVDLPGLGGLDADEVTDTAARVRFTVNPGGARTTYRLVVNGSAIGPVTVGAGTDDVDIGHALSGLQPGARYDVQVIVSNAAGEQFDTLVFNTAARVTGVAGEPTRLVLTGTADVCPGQAQIAWGDGTTSVANVTCNGLEYRLDATHTYASPARYRIAIAYDAAPGETAFADVAARPADPDPQPPTPTPIATTSPAPPPTPTPPPPTGPTPTVAVDVVAAPSGGTVLVKLPGTSKFVQLKAGQALPYGTEIDTRKGRVTLTSIPKAGAAPETAEFYDGLFKVTYVGGITNVTLTEPLAACPKGRASAAAKKAKTRKLWGKGKGAFRTTGRYSAATVRGTTWLVQDTCAGTLTRVTQGVVEVRDSVTKKQIVVRAGKKYLAKPKRR